MPAIINRKRRTLCGFTIVELLIAMLVGTTLVAMTLPLLLKLERNFRSAGDARVVNGQISLAKLRAAADFTRARVYADTTANTLSVQIWCKTVVADCVTANTWLTESVVATLSTGDTFGYGSLSTPPSNTQTTMGQASACQTDGQTIAATAGTVSNSACVIFNSRGIPIDSTGAPTGQDAIYITDGTSVYGATLMATGLVKQWRTDIGTANWKQR